MAFEDVGIAYYSEQDYSQRVLTHPNAKSLPENIETTANKWKNPYAEAYLWIKGEYLDV